MKNFVKCLLKRILYIFRIRPPKRLLNVDDYIRTSVYKPLLVRFYDLKELTAFLSSINQQERYNDLLVRLVPGYESVATDRSEFIGQGAGKYILNVYRKIDRADKPVFEKVYFSQSRKLQSVQWFYANCYTELTKSFKVPDLLHVYCGDLICILHYEFFRLVRKNVSEKELIELGKQLMQISNTLENLNEDIPDYIKNYREHNAYAGYIEVARKELDNNGVDVNRIEKIVGDNAFFFSHGDLHEENIYSDGVVIDWDFFGYYPIGFEQAQMYCQMLVRDKKHDYLQAMQWLEINHKELDRCDLNQMKFNFAYFLYVFCQTLFVQNRCLDLQPVLLEQIKINLKACESVN